MQHLTRAWKEGCLFWTHAAQVVQPRRVAAKAAARRMASLLHERPSARIGFATRLERALSQRTCIEVVTTGVLLRRLQTVRAQLCMLPDLAPVGLRPAPRARSLHATRLTPLE
jgi:hypothetical protein